MNLLKCLTALVVAASTVTAAPQIADACGGSYGAEFLAPRVHLVSQTGTRGFIGLGKSTVKLADRDWRRIWPSSYDYTAIADQKFAGSRVFTLVGPSGTRVVKSHGTMLVSSTFVFTAPQNATEVKIGREENFVIALPGENKDARWLTADELGTSRVSKLGWVIGGLELGSRTYMLVNIDGEVVATLI
jgi:hypothetical protein